MLMNKPYIQKLSGDTLYFRSSIISFWHVYLSKQLVFELYRQQIC